MELAILYSFKISPQGQGYVSLGIGGRKEMKWEKKKKKSLVYALYGVDTLH
jgi:hypothetical protein